MKRVILVSTAGWLFSAPLHVSAQVVQLPTFNFFGINTTVSVPDSGAGFVGGNSVSSMGRFERGLPVFGHAPVAGRPFGSRAIAGRTQASGVSVRATIHDFEFMDESLLGGADIAQQQTPLSAPHRLTGRGVDDGSRRMRSVATPTVGDAAGRVSIAELRRRQASQAAAARDDGRSDFERARSLLAVGKLGTARVYLERALKRADPALRAEINSEIRRQHVSASPPTAVAGLAVER